ncbi:MAG: helix-turn-helix domain-containing protein [Aggregatilineales bacterium]
MAIHIPAQNFADMVKGYILRARLDTETMMEALQWIKRLERSVWDADAMMAAVESAGDGRWAIGDDVIITGDDTEIIASIEAVLQHYHDNYAAQYMDDADDDKWYTMREAAAYLDISYDMMKTYASREKRIRGVMKGRSMLFSRQQLEDFNRKRRAVGRPAGE